MTVYRSKRQELAKRIDERNEKLKQEMLGKLKEVGNKILGKFGMSVDNFKMVQDPATGGYSIKYDSSTYFHWRTAANSVYVAPPTKTTIATFFRIPVSRCGQDTI